MDSSILADSSISLLTLSSQLSFASHSLNMNLPSTTITLRYRSRSTSWLLRSITACTSALASFETFLWKEFDVRELDGHTSSDLGCKIYKLLNGSIPDTQSTNSDTIETACLHTRRTDEGDLPAADTNTQAIWRVLGQTLYSERTTSFILLYYASVRACKTSDFYLHHLKKLQSNLSRSLT